MYRRLQLRARWHACLSSLIFSAGRQSHVGNFSLFLWSCISWIVADRPHFRSFVSLSCDKRFTDGRYAATGRLLTLCPESRFYLLPSSTRVQSCAISAFDKIWKTSLFVGFSTLTLPTVCLNFPYTRCNALLHTTEVGRVRRHSLNAFSKPSWLPWIFLSRAPQHLCTQDLGRGWSIQ